MAVDAVLLGLLEQDDLAILPGSESVTPVTSQRCVSPLERKCRPAMIEGLESERVHSVTELTRHFPAGRRSLPPLGIMDVVVTGGAPVGERPESHRFALSGRKGSSFQFVAFGASDRSMPAQKLEAGILVVIEVERLPFETHRAVTDPAVARKLAQMRISVAGSTERLERFVADRLGQTGGKSAFLRPMATRTVHLNVFAGKRVGRVLVIARPSLEPFHGMAVGAVRFELPPMGVVLMTIVATVKRHALEALALMALRTSDAIVPTAEWIPCSFVIEGANTP